MRSVVFGVSILVLIVSGMVLFTLLSDGWESAPGLGILAIIFFVCAIIALSIAGGGSRHGSSDYSNNYRGYSSRGYRGGRSSRSSGSSSRRSGGFSSFGNTRRSGGFSSFGRSGGRSRSGGFKKSGGGSFRKSR